MEIVKIIITFIYGVGINFLGLVIRIEQPKFQSEFKRMTILHSKNKEQ
jgi:hypothetical protein